MDADTSSSAPVASSTGSIAGVIILIILIIAFIIIIYFVARREKKKTGDGCGGSGECSGSQVCQSSRCVEQTGGMCSTTSDCVTGDVCDTTTGRCTTSTPSGLNKQCNTTTMKCQNGQMCISGLCKSEVGSPCGGSSPTSDCVTGSSCSPTLSICVSTTAGSFTGPCINGDSCNSGLVCTNGICLTSSGGSCQVNPDCASGVCAMNRCSGGGSGGNPSCRSFSNRVLASAWNGSQRQLSIQGGSLVGFWIDPPSAPLVTSFWYDCTTKVLAASLGGIRYIAVLSPSNCQMRFVRDDWTSTGMGDSTRIIPGAVSQPTQWDITFGTESNNNLPLVITIPNNTTSPQAGTTLVLGADFGNSLPQDGADGFADFGPVNDNGNNRPTACIPVGSAWFAADAFSNFTAIPAP